MKNHFKPRGEKPIQEGFDPRAYHALGQEFPRGDVRRVMSRSELCSFAKCPAKWIRGGDEEESTISMDWGSLLDVLITQPGQFDKLYAVAPKEYPGTLKKKDDPIEMKAWNWNATFCKDWEKDQTAAGKEIATAPQAEKAFAAQERLQEDRILLDFISRSRKQVFVSVNYHDPETKIVVPFKCLLDFAPMPDDEEYGNTLGDLKTTADATPRNWRRTVFTQGWHIQAAIYIDAMNAASGCHYTQMAHVVSESVKPYEPARRMLIDGEESFLHLGRIQYLEMLALYARCIHTGIFPGYDDNDECRGGVLHGWRFVDPDVWMLKD